MSRIISAILFTFLFTRGNTQSNGLTVGSIGYHLNRATEMAREKKYDQALAMVDSTMLKDSLNEHIYALKAEFLWFSKKYYEAALCYEKAMLLNKDSSYLKGAYLFLGVLYEKAGVKETARKNYLKAIDLLENYQRKDDRQFAGANLLDYVVALKLSGTEKGFSGLMSDLVNDPRFSSYKELYRSKSREEVFDDYWKQFEHN